MRRRSKTAASYRLAQNVKYVDTAGELGFDDLAALWGYPCLKPEPVGVVDEDGVFWRLKPDRQITINKETFYAHIDGHHFHRRSHRQESKDHWRDRAIFGVTKRRSIHIPDYYFNNEFLKATLFPDILKAIRETPKDNPGIYLPE